MPTALPLPCDSREYDLNHITTFDGDTVCAFLCCLTSRRARNVGHAHANTPPPRCQELGASVSRVRHGRRIRRQHGYRPPRAAAGSKSLTSPIARRRAISERTEHLACSPRHEARSCGRLDHSSPSRTASTLEQPTKQRSRPAFERVAAKAQRHQEHDARRREAVVLLREHLNRRRARVAEQFAAGRRRVPRHHRRRRRR
mmetsp:Transcript_70199/g.211039  ORF Transcript_70199/g.211039 Transcript_70199/m.211039 type:complete len:200 (+) Transcript_70199:75-674(+)